MTSPPQPHETDDRRAAPGGKSLSATENERVRLALRELLSQNGEDQSALARKLKVAQPTISALLSGRQGTSYRFAIRLASLLGRPLSSLLDLPDEATTGSGPSEPPEQGANRPPARGRGYRSSGPDSGAFLPGVTLGQQPNWDFLVGEVKKLAPDTPEWVLARLARVNPLMSEPLSVQGLLDLCGWYRKHSTHRG